MGRLVAPPQLGDELSREKDFADADGVDPDVAAALEALPHLRLEEAQPLHEALPVAAPPQHFHEKGREKGQQREGQEQVVNG